MRRHVMILAAMALITALAMAGCGPDVSAPEAPSEAPETGEVSPEPTASPKPAAAESAQPEVSATEAPSKTPETSEVSPEPAAAEPGFNAGNALPDFSVPLAGGGTFTLSENLGKPVFINLFATWCPSCVGGMPDINQLYKEFGGQVNFLVINIGEDEQTALNFADDNGYTLPFAYSIDGMPFGFTYLVYSIPRTFVLDADGVISAYYEGMRDYDTFKAAIQAALVH